ncbi:MAG: glycosyltransferase family 9 protein [Bacteroidales bacterium]|jgi:ADP-heptose:LPS heptosyltransferase|nr:glycosyltransferase family 9 protein [Bacteroidales bacterium]
MKITVVLRFSSLGDVAMLIPVIYPIAIEHPGDRFVVVTKGAFADVFVNKPQNISVVPAELGGRHRKFTGLFRLAFDIVGHLKALSRQGGCSFRKTQVQIADMHCLLRSLSVELAVKTVLLAHFKSTKSKPIDKGFFEKRKLCAATDKELTQLKTTHRRYADVFAALGYPDLKPFKPLFRRGKHGKIITIGIAPLAFHVGKIWPLERMQLLIEKLLHNPNIRIIIFGGGNDFEIDLANLWTGKYENVSSAIGIGGFEKELELMSTLRVMVSMDSANMHLASLVGVPVVSLWGQTHPFAGFYGYGQNPALAAQVDLACRPCSVYGQLSCCTEKDYECINTIPVSDVLSKIRKALYLPYTPSSSNDLPQS